MGSLQNDRVIGKYYEIELNEDWEIIEINDKGDLEIIRKKEKK